MQVLALALGVVIAAGTAISVFTTLVVPRATSSRLLRAIARVMASTVRPVIRRLRNFEASDRLMAVVGPFSLVAVFVVWLVLLIVGFALISWGIDGGGFVSAFDVAGSSVFTLGFATGRGAGSEPVEFVAAGAGLLVIALEIAYLPTLYSAFSSRESLVTLLASRAGAPAWGPEILARHHWFKTEDELPGLYSSWEAWAAGLAESHASYPTLMWFRSPASSRSWLLALTAMLDAAALHDATRPSTAPRQARVLLSMGIQCLRSLARALRIPYDADPRPDSGIRLTRDEFVRGYERLQDVGYECERDLDEAWTHFQGWRINYEALVDRLTQLMMPPPAPWLLDRPYLGRVQHPYVVDRTPEDPDPDPPKWGTVKMGRRARMPAARGGSSW